MSKQTQISFTAPTQNTDGSAIVDPLSYVAFIDIVNPPLKEFPIPASVVAVAGVVTVSFQELGFAPIENTNYYVDVVATDAEGSSAPSAVLHFAYAVVPNGPTFLKVF